MSSILLSAYGIDMNIKIMSFYKLETTDFTEPTAVISVSSDQTHPYLPKKNVVDFICMSFADRDAGPDIMQSDFARIILKFAEKNKDKTIVCQCDAGRSRSAGMAAALSKIYNGTDDWVFSNKLYIPNMHVYRTILEEAHYLRGIGC